MVKLLKDVRKYKSYISFATKAQLKSEVSNAYLDWLWWVLEPIGYMMIYVVIFQGIFKTTAEYFTIFVYTGNIMWGFFSKVLFSSVNMIRARQNIISRVYVPKFVFIISEILVNMFKMFINLSLAFGLMIILRVDFSWRIINIIPILVVLYLFTFGMSMILMHIGVFVKDMEYVINIGLNMWMFMSGIFYSLESFEEPIRTMITNCNPIAFLLTCFRNSLIYARDINYLVLGIWFIISLILVLFGVFVVYKNENSYVKVI